MKKLAILYFSLALFLFASVGKIAVTKGEVFVVRDGESIPAQSGFELMQNDTIKTADGARAQLVFNDETVVSVGKGSEFVVESYAFEADAGAQAQEASFKSLKGAFKTITGKIGKVAPEKFKLATKTATIGIRGTHFLGKINIDGDKIACTHGAISVASLAGGEPVVVPAGQITSVLAGAMPTPPRKYTAAEITQLNEASGAAPQEGEAAPEATGGDEGAAGTDEEEGATGALVVEEEALPEEVVATAETIIQKADTVVSLSEVVPKDVKKIIKDTVDEENAGGKKLDPGEEVDTILDTVVTPDISGGYPLTHIAASGPIDLYGRTLTSYISTPDCENSDCSIGTSTSAVNYFYDSATQFYRNGTQVWANHDGTGNNLGVENDYEVTPYLIGVQDFSAALVDTYTDAGGTLGTGDDITGIEMMSSPTGNYEGYNVEYRLETNDPGDTDIWTEHDYLSYDNLGEFAIVTSETVDPSVDGGMYRNAFYMGKKSSWDYLSGTDIPDHLIYKVLMSHSISYDGSSEFSSDFYNGLATGTDYSGSRVIGNTHNGNILYVGKPQDNGRGWGIVLGTAGTGSSNEITFDGNLHVWVNGNKDSTGNYYIETQVDTIIDGELYGSELQGFGMTISSTTPSVFDQTVVTSQTSPGAFDASIVAGYRTDDAGQINLDTLLTGTATMSGFAISKIFLSDASTGSIYSSDHSGGVIEGLTINRDTGSISGMFKMGGGYIDDPINATPDTTLTVSGTGGQTSAFISDDYFASVITDGTNSYYDMGPLTAVNAAGGMMATNPGFALDDVTWGYWTAAYTDGTTDMTYHHKSAWVAGIDTSADKIAGLVSAAGGSAGVEVYTFEGKILGRISGNGPSGTINSDASWVRVAVDFGSQTPVSGSMIFTAVDYPEIVWYVNIDDTGSTLDSSTGRMYATLSGNANSVMKVMADPNSGISDAGGLYADLYGADGTAIGGEFYATGTINNSDYLAAIGVFKGATDQTLTAPTVGTQKILVGSHMSTWIDNPTGTDDSSRDAAQTSGSSAGYISNSAFYISVDGDTGTYRNFGQLSYSWTLGDEGFTAEYENPYAGSLTVGTGTTQDETTMTTAVGGYTGVTAEDMSSADTDKFVVYDNLKDFFIILESSNLDAAGEATRSLLYAGTPFESMSGESNLIGYSMVASADLTYTGTEFSSGAYSPLLDGSGVLALEANLVLNRSNNKAVFVTTPYENGDGTYTLESMVGILDQTTGTITGQGYDVSNGGASGTVNYGYSTAGATIFGSANQGIGITLNSQEELISTAGIRTDTPAGVALTPTTDTDGSTDSVNWVGSLAGVRNAASGDAFEHGIITGLTIDKTNGIVDTTNSTPYLTLGLVSGGVVTTPSEYIDISSTYSAYASDDYIVMGLDAAYYGTSFTAADGGGVMVTSPDGVEDDYASWGYWGASFGDPTTTGFEFVPISTWVAGQVASSTVMAALEAAGTSMSFSGHALGYVSTFNNTTSQFENFQAIDSVNSVVSLSVDFGTTNPISGNITFSPTADSALVWSMDVGTNTITAANAGFDVSSFSTGSGSTVVIGNSEMHGNFYSDGSSVTSLGGSFASGGLYGTDVVSANGVIKATKNP